MSTARVLAAKRRNSAGKHSSIWSLWSDHRGILGMHDAQHWIYALVPYSYTFSFLTLPVIVQFLACSTLTMATTNGMADAEDTRAVFFFDIDNCLYTKAYKIHEHMSVLIDNYFQSHLSMSREDATMLHQRYYKDYGLAIEGLVRHHRVDPLEYNAKVDDALPLDDIIKPDDKLRRLLEDIDRQRIKPWLFTNAYINHARKVVKLLGVEDLFEGITFCDYGAEKLLCKPDPAMFDKAMREAGVVDPTNCYYVDDSALNCVGGKKYGLKTVHLVEEGSSSPPEPACDHQIKHLEELRALFPEVFRTGS